MKIEYDNSNELVLIKDEEEYSFSKKESKNSWSMSATEEPLTGVSSACTNAASWNMRCNSSRAVTLRLSDPLLTHMYPLESI